MKITVKREIKEEVEIDIEFPSYFKNKSNILKAISETSTLWVRSGGDISPNYLGLDFVLENNFEPSTSEEFNAALEAAINHINELNK